jgi:Ca2+-binding EF-hand superfamily protein
MITTGAFISLNIVFAGVFAIFDFAVYNDKISRQDRSIANIKHAFKVLDVHSVGYLSYSQIKEVLEELYANFYDFSRNGVPSDAEQIILISALDKDGDKRIKLDEFLLIVDLTRIVITTEEVGYKYFAFFLFLFLI